MEYSSLCCSYKHT